MMMTSSLVDLRLVYHLGLQLRQLVERLLWLETQPLAFEQPPLLPVDFVVVKLLQRQQQLRLLEMDLRAGSIIYPEDGSVASINSELRLAVR